MRSGAGCNRGSISGTVTDQTGAVIAGAGVALVNLDLATGFKTTTDEYSSNNGTGA
jgi:hypothetical protein